MLSLSASLICCFAAFSATNEFATAAPPKAADHVRVLTFNLWQEGTSVEGGFEKIVDVVVASRADLVALTEVRNYGGKDLHERLLAACKAKGVSYRGVFAGGDVGLLSRFPIVGTEVASDDGEAQAGPIMAYSIELPGGKAACVCVAHLDYRNYAAYLPRGYDGNSFQMIDRDGDGEPDPITRVSDIQRMDEASSRDEAVKAFLRYAKTRKRNRIPVILTGDFNEASHLDWTRATRDLWDHNGVVMPWENSTRLAKGGFIDAWREVHSDPVKRPGHTWPSSAF
ncbi:MAG: endonuclease/exonuclease/phosphatase family protein, partial [Planctomycetota bacterium]